MMWSELIPLKDEKGQSTDVDLLVLDAEGFGAARRGFDVDARLFTLLNLLTSTLIYNQAGTISEESLENLSMVQMLSSQIKCRHAQEQVGASERDLKHLLPNFIWVLRDFSSSFKTMDAQAYMTHCLDKERGSSDEILHNNSVKQSLKKLYPSLHCFQFGSPNDKGGFAQNAELFVDHIFS